MDSINVESTSEYLINLTHDKDALEDLKDFACENEVESAVFALIGAVKSATIAFYDQAEKKYDEISFKEPFEIISCNGNIANKDGGKFIHAHACLAREDGSTIAGHITAMRIFAGEAHVRVFKQVINRKHDDVTGLGLMDLKTSGIRAREDSQTIL